MRRVFSLAVVVLGLGFSLPLAAQPPAAAPGQGNKQKSGGEQKAGGAAKHKGKAQERAEKRGDRKDDRAAKRKERAARKQNEAKPPKKDERSPAERVRDAARVKRLQQRAERLRAAGDEKNATRLEKRSKRIAAGREIESEKTQNERRRKSKLRRLKALQKMYGTELERTGVRDELRRHARVSARLGRMKALAEEKDDDALLQRIESLYEKEQAKHDARMTKLTGKSPKKAPRVKKNHERKSKDGAKPKKENE